MDGSATDGPLQYRSAEKRSAGAIRKIVARLLVALAVMVAGVVSTFNAPATAASPTATANQSLLSTAPHYARGVVASGSFLYWTNTWIDPGVTAGTTIGRSNLDGTGAVQNFVQGASIPSAIVIVAPYIYWTNTGTNSIARANLTDGLNPELLFIPNANGPVGLATDGASLYWTNFTGDSIGRAALDGTSPTQTFVTGANGPYHVVAASGHVYWTNFNNNNGTSSIGRADADGQNVNQFFITTAVNPTGITLANNKLYWSNYLLNTIGVATLDRSIINRPFFAGLHGPVGISIVGNDIYWANFDTKAIGHGTLDSVAPVLTVPADITVNAANPGANTVTYPTPVSATDATDVAGDLTVTCSPGTLVGGSFTVATTTAVTCTASDVSANITTQTFNVTVNTPAAPTLTLPANISQVSPSNSGAVVNYTATSTAGTPTCVPASGATFPIGLTTVSCSVTDAFGQTATGTFTVTLTTPDRVEIEGCVLTSGTITITDAAASNGAAVFGNGPSVTYTASCTSATAAGSATLRVRYKSANSYVRKLWVNGVQQYVTWTASPSSYASIDIPVTVTASTTFVFDLSYVTLDAYDLLPSVPPTTAPPTTASPTTAPPTTAPPTTGGPTTVPPTTAPPTTAPPTTAPPTTVPATGRVEIEGCALTSGSSVVADALASNGHTVFGNAVSVTYIASCTSNGAPGAATLHVRYKDQNSYVRRLWINNVQQLVTWPNTHGAFATLDIPVTLTASTSIKFDLSYVYFDYYDLIPSVVPTTAPPTTAAPTTAPPTTAGPTTAPPTTAPPTTAPPTTVPATGRVELENCALTAGTSNVTDALASNGHTVFGNAASVTYTATCLSNSAPGNAMLHVRYKDSNSYVRQLTVNGALRTVTWTNTHGTFATLDIPVTLNASNTFKFDLSYVYLDYYDLVPTSSPTTVAPTTAPPTTAPPTTAPPTTAPPTTAPPTTVAPGRVEIEGCTLTPGTSNVIDAAASAGHSVFGNAPSLTYTATCTSSATLGTAVLHIRYKSPSTYTRKLWLNNVSQNVTYPATGSVYANLDIIVNLTASTTLKFDLSYLYLDYYQLVALP